MQQPENAGAEPAVDHSNHDTARQTLRVWRSKPGVALLMLAVIAMFYLLREQYHHVWPLLPYFILLLCPLMHLFGHHHGGHTRQDSRDTPADEHRK